MTTKEKYQPVLDLGEQMTVQDGYVKEEDGKLKFGGIVPTAYDKNRLWDKIKEIGGAAPTDIEADIDFANKEYFADHVVQSGDSLYKIAQKYYGESHGMKYKEIHAANQDVIGDNPDVIHPGQELRLPFLDQ
jgi:LysM repeat protein